MSLDFRFTWSYKDICEYKYLFSRRKDALIRQKVSFVIFAQIAQLVEQRTENPRVAGSIPALGILNAEGCLGKNLAFKM